MSALVIAANALQCTLPNNLNLSLYIFSINGIYVFLVDPLIDLFKIA
jgi:hypothetical protein